MQIRKAKIFNFGKLQNKTYLFEDGINLIYGENEAGKTTLHAFLKSMLFGMEKTKGRASQKDVYLHYEPWHAPSYYSGILHFTVGDKPFYLERNFYTKEKQDRLCNEADGEELSVAYGDLEMLLGGVSKETYENTLDVAQCGVAPNGKMAELLAEYLSDASGSGNASVKVTKALQALEQQKKERRAQLRKYQAAKAEMQKKLQFERELVEKELTEQKELLQRARVQQERAAAEAVFQQEEEEDSPAEKNETIRKGSRLGWIGVVLAVANVFAWLLLRYPAPLFAGLEIIFLGLLLAGRFGRWKSNTTVEEKELQTKSNSVQQENAGQQMVPFVQKLEESVQEKEARLVNLGEELCEAEQKDLQERGLEEDMEALELAAAEIVRISEELSEDIRDELDAEISRQISGITGGKYDRIRVDEKGQLEVFAEGRKVSPEQLSRGTCEQFYLALRLAVGEIVTQEEPLPILLDEVFSMYDEKRLEQALRMLAASGHQILLFTCQKREEELLKKLEIPYNKVHL